MTYTAEFSYTTHHYVELDSNTPDEAMQLILSKTYGDAPNYKPDRDFLAETLESNSIGEKCDDVSVEVKILEWPEDCDGDCEPILRAHENGILYDNDCFKIPLTHDDVDLVLSVLSERLGERKKNESLPYRSESETYRIKRQKEGYDKTDKLKIAYNRIKHYKLANTINYESEKQKMLRTMALFDDR